MMEIQAAQVMVSRKEFVRALNRRMTLFKWLLLICLAAIPLGFATGEYTQALSMTGGAFIFSLIIFLSGIQNSFAYSRKDAAFIFKARRYSLTDGDIIIEYADQSKTEFSKSAKLKIKRKKNYFTVTDKARFEIIPMSVFGSDGQKEAFISAYLKRS